MRLVVVLSFLLSSGCAYRTSSVVLAQPAVVTHVAVSGEGASPEIADRTRHMIDRANQHAHGAPMAMSVAVQVDKPRSYLAFLQEDGIAAMLIVWPVLAGVVTERAKLSVDVVITSGDRLLHGHGTAEKEGSLYAPAQKRALAVALGQAVASAR